MCLCDRCLKHTVKLNLQPQHLHILRSTVDRAMTLQIDVSWNSGFTNFMHVRVYVRVTHLHHSFPPYVVEKKIIRHDLRHAQTWGVCNGGGGSADPHLSLLSKYGPFSSDGVSGSPKSHHSPQPYESRCHFVPIDGAGAFAQNQVLRSVYERSWRSCMSAHCILENLVLNLAD